MLPPLLATLALVAQAAPVLELVPAQVRPGDALLVQVTDAPAAPAGTAAGRPLAFWAAGDGAWRALAALPLETAPGAVPVRVAVAGTVLAAELQVVEPGFTRHEISLDQKYVEPPPSAQKRIAADRKAFAEAFSQPFAEPLFAGDFDWPRRAKTSGRYGDQRLLNGRVSSIHYGLDITGPRGAPVAAANDGRVAITRAAYLSGNTIVLWHGAGLYTAYFHLDRILVRQGQRVRKGQVIGRLGSTGRVTGPHLHWGVKLSGLYVDPESLLAIDFEHGTAPPRAAGAPEEKPAEEVLQPEPPPSSSQP
ncbi:MAG TPA: M23 family metallopeptidase [Anaeromyxobacter sp.]|nr:M23 family metallopeptidase [Anaeromyxobacter sp.]